MSFIFIFIVYLSLSFLASTAWRNRGMNQIYGFLLGLCASPLGSYLICLALKENKDSLKEEMLEEFHRNLNMIKQRSNNIIDIDNENEEGL